MIRAPKGYLLWGAYNLKIYETEWGCVKTDVALSVRKLDYWNCIFCPCLCRKLSAIRPSDIYHLPYGLRGKNHTSTAFGLKSLRKHSWVLVCFGFQMKWWLRKAEGNLSLCLHHDLTGSSWLCSSVGFWEWPFDVQLSHQFEYPRLIVTESLFAFTLFFQIFDAEWLITEHLAFFSISETLQGMSCLIAAGLLRGKLRGQ